MRRALAGLLLVAACGGVRRAAALDPAEHVRGERQRVVQIPVEQLWPAVLGALGDEGVRVAHADRGRGAIATRSVRVSARETPRRLAEIADLSRTPAPATDRSEELKVAKG